jgi:hypothetical protein
MSAYGNAHQNYDQRQGVNVNIGEELFMAWCNRHGWDCTRLGFDEKFANVSAFYNLNAVLRNMPDYVIQREEKMFVVNVKGTPNIKENERLLLPELINAYSTNKAPLVYAFCIRNKMVKFAEAEHVMGLYDIEHDQRWSDGKIFRTIRLEYVR